MKSEELAETLEKAADVLHTRAMPREGMRTITAGYVLWGRYALPCGVTSLHPAPLRLSGSPTWRLKNI